MTSESPNDGRAFRWGIGVIVMMAAIGGFSALFFIRVPPENKDAMMFALGSVFGWAAAVVGSEYGATTTGRKVAESAVRQIERQTIANESPSQVEVVNDHENPVPVTKDGDNG